MNEFVVKPVVGTAALARFPLILGGVVSLILAVTFVIAPSGVLNMFLETVPGLIAIVLLALTFRRFPMSRWIYVCIFVHILVLTYGGYNTYALNPAGEWVKATFQLARNPYDRLGHFSQGFFPAFVIREVLLRKTPLMRGGWLNFLTVCVAEAFSALYELFEWRMAVIMDPKGGDAFLGTQGDIWDAQWDMFMCLTGATTALLLLRKAHDASMQRLFASTT